MASSVAGTGAHSERLALCSPVRAHKQGHRVHRRCRPGRSTFVSFVLCCAIGPRVPSEGQILGVFVTHPLAGLAAAARPHSLAARSSGAVLCVYICSFGCSLGHSYRSLYIGFGVPKSIGTGLSDPLYTGQRPWDFLHSHSRNARVTVTQRHRARCAPLISFLVASETGTSADPWLPRFRTRAARWSVTCARRAPKAARELSETARAVGPSDGGMNAAHTALAFVSCIGIG